MYAAKFLKYLFGLINTQKLRLLYSKMKKKKPLTIQIELQPLSD